MHRVLQELDVAAFIATLTQVTSPEKNDCAMRQCLHLQVIGASWVSESPKPWAPHVEAFSASIRVWFSSLVSGWYLLAVSPPPLQPPASPGLGI